MSPNTFITIIIKGPSLPTQNTLVGSFIGCQSWQSGRTALLLLLLWGSGGRREAPDGTAATATVGQRRPA